MMTGIVKKQGVLSGIFCLIFMTVTACIPPEREMSPVIDGELALQYAEQNVAFGNRYAGSDALAESAEWILKTLNSVSGKYELEKMEFKSPTPMGNITFRNLIVNWPGPDKDYVILGAHYDTKRFFSGMRFDGANDGASGVGVLLAVHHALSKLEKLPIGIRLVFFDGEECMLQYQGNDGLVGSRYLAEQWEKNGELAHCKAMLLLDMVGDKDLCFTLPENSDPKLLKLVFQEADRLQLRKHLSMYRSSILDDHVPFMEKSVPALDFIDFQYGPGNSYWHSSRDTMDKISAESLKIAGDLALAVIWRLAD